MSPTKMHSEFSYDNEGRPLANVEIFGTKIVGLLDSGASCTIVGGKLASWLRELVDDIEQSPIILRTADGTHHKAQGEISIPCTFAETTKEFKIVLAPTMSEGMILGMDFWRLFQIRPKVSSAYTIETIKTEHELSQEELESLKKTIKTLPIAEPGRIGTSNLISHEIDVGTAKPVKQRPYYYAPAMEEKIKQEIDRMLKLDVIEPAYSPWGNPLVAVPKSNGDIRVCLDSRKLNEVTKKDAYSIPMITRILSRLRESKYITTIDLKDAFWQIPLAANSKEKTAFTVPGRGQFQFKKMPFGLCNAAQTQSRLMDRVLGFDLEPYVFAYIDDIVIMSNSFSAHVDLISEVALRLQKAGLTVNLDKCRFCRKKVTYLGYVISESGLETDQEKIEPILNYPEPGSVKEVRQFLGMAGWYRRFIKNFADLAAPISECLKNPKTRFKWSEDASKAFKEIKLALISAPILSNPDFSKLFTIQADACNYGVGAVLTQGEGDEETVIAYYSQKLNAAQLKYTTTEKECLAVLMAIKSFKCYVEGSRFKVITDHASLKWLKNVKDPTGRLGRWAIKLQQYDIEIIHRKGVNHVVPDALSRNIGQVTVERDKTDKWYNDLARKIESDPEKYSAFKIENGLIYKHVIDGFEFVWKLLIPKSKISDVLKENHDDACHFGFVKTLRRIQHKYYWPKMIQDVKYYVNQCDTCKASKPHTKIPNPPLGAPKFARRPWQTISTDYFGPVTRSTKGFRHVLVVSDWFSKQVRLFATRDATATITVKHLEDGIFYKDGVPETLISDNGGAFNSNELKDTLEKFGVAHKFNASYHPQHNPSERIMKVVGASLRSVISGDQTHWSDYIPKIECMINTSWHESTKFTPYHIDRGREMILNGKDYSQVNPAELDIPERDDHLHELRKIVKTNIEKAYTRYSKYYNLRSKPVGWKAGDVIWRKNFALSNAAAHYSKKLDKKFIKCRIKRAVGSSTYEIEDLNGKYVGIFHAKDLKE